MSADYRVGFGEDERHVAWFDSFGEALQFARKMVPVYEAEKNPHQTIGIYRADGGQLTSGQLDRWLYDEADEAPAPAVCDNCGEAGSPVVVSYDAMVDGPGELVSEERCSECARP